MIRWLLLFLALALPAEAQDTPLLLRVQVEPAGPVWIGQRVTVTLTAMTPIRFIDPIDWPDLAAREGRIIALPEASTLPGTERQGGQSYAALLHSYTLFPATPGQLSLTPIVLHANVAGPDGAPVAASATVEIPLVTARLPPGVTDAGRLIVAPSFTLHTDTDGATKPLHVGDAVTRTVTMQAEDTAAMMLPPAVWSAPEGVRVYPDPPVLQDHAARGTLQALRRERAAFVPQRPGPVELPGFAVSWLDPRNRQVQQLTVPALRLDVLPAAGPAPPHRWPWRPITAVMLGLLLAATIWWAWRRHRHLAVNDGYAALRQACRAGEPRPTLRALYRWADAILPPDEGHTLARLAALSATPALLSEAQRLEAVIFGQGTSWDGAALAAAARQARQRLGRPAAPQRAAALPPLNPLPPPALAPRLTQPRWVR